MPPVAINSVANSTLTIKEPEIAPEQPTALVIEPVYTDCDLVYNYNWDTRTARAVCMAESGGNANAIHYNDNGTYDSGLMQINSIHGLDNALDPKTNMDKAYQMYNEQGWTPWCAYLNKSYLRFL